MRRILTAVFLLAVACYGQTPSALESDPQGWKDIMPGPSFEGWTRLPFMSTQPLNPVSQWKVDPAAKVLVCEGNGGHEWLRYDKELTDAIFHAEYRFTKIEGGKGYNSGVMIRNSADGSVWIQAQAGEQGAGWVFGNAPVNGNSQRWNQRAQMKEDRMKPAGEWNVYEIRAQGPKVTNWVNGAVVSESPVIDTLKGYAGLEAEGYRIEFRNLKLKELK